MFYFHDFMFGVGNFKMRCAKKFNKNINLKNT